MPVDYLLTNRAKVRRAMYRLLSTDGSDKGLTENGESAEEVANYCIQHGIWNAQKFLIRIGFREWLKNTSALVWDAAAADGTRSVALADDFLRLAGDERRGALLDSKGRPWGGQINPRDKRRAGPRAFWIENGKIHLGRGASPPNGLYYEYHYKHAKLADDVETLDFPEDWTPLIPGEAAFIGMHEGWYLLDGDGEAKIAQNRAYWQGQAAPWFRQTQEPQKLRPPDVVGTHIFL